MNAVEHSVEVKRRATALGFTMTGIARLEKNPHAAELDRWLAAGHAGTMTYLHRQAEKRKDPRMIMPGAKSAVVTLTNYFHGSLRSRVAQYAWSSDTTTSSAHGSSNWLRRFGKSLRDLPRAATSMPVRCPSASLRNLPASDGSEKT